MFLVFLSFFVFWGRFLSFFVFWGRFLENIGYKFPSIRWSQEICMKNIKLTRKCSTKPRALSLAGNHLAVARTVTLPGLRQAVGLDRYARSAIRTRDGGRLPKGGGIQKLKSFCSGARFRFFVWRQKIEVRMW